MVQNGISAPAGHGLQRMLRRLTPVQAACIAGVLLLLGNFPYLTNPPFWDDILGLHRQAVFLADHRFNLCALWASGDFWSGGALIYKVNWPSLLYGMLYFLFPPGVVHCLGHLFNIAVLAASAGCVFQVLRLNGVPPAAALLWSLAMICEPVVSAQGVSLGQEILLVGCFSGFLLMFSRERHRCALGFLILGALIKPAALIPATAYCMVLAWDLWKSRSRQNILRMAGAAVVWIGIFSLLIVDSDGAAGNVWGTLGGRINDMWLYFPLLLILALSGMVGGVFRIFREGMDREYILWLLWIGGFFAGYLLYSVPLPRYTACVVPVCILLAGRSFPYSRYGAFVFLLAGIIMQGGALHRPLPGHLHHSGEFLERDRAFLKQIDMDREVCTFLENESGSNAVVAKWPYVQMLADRRYGYVQKPLKKIYCAGILPKKMENVQKYSSRELAKTPGVYYIFVCNSFEFFRDFGEPLAPRRGDVPVWMPADRQLRGYFLVYRKGKSINHGSGKDLSGRR